MVYTEVIMKRLPKLPYLQNIVEHYRQMVGSDDFGYYADGSYQRWLSTLGFALPVYDYLEFPDDFSDRDLALFILRWS